MSIEKLLDQIQIRFDPQIARAVVSAFRAEPLAWHFLESTPNLEQWLTFASDDLSRWQPGVLALFSLGDSLHEQDLTNLEINLPTDIIDRVANVFEMTRLTGLEPTSLADAALLALHLREFRRREGSWKALSDELLSGKGRLPVWKTAFAILPQLVPDFETAMDSLVSTLATTHAQALGELIVHQVIVSQLEVPAIKPIAEGFKKLLSSSRFAPFAQCAPLKRIRWSNSSRIAFWLSRKDLMGIPARIWSNQRLKHSASRRSSVSLQGSPHKPPARLTMPSMP